MEYDKHMKLKRFMKINRLFMHSKHHQLEALGLYRGQPRLLFLLWKTDGLSRKEIVDHLGIQPATVTKMVKRLENNEFVVSKADANDSRVSRVYLTPKGHDIHGAVEEIYEHYYEILYGGLSEEEIISFESILGKIEDNMKAEGITCGKGGRHEKHV